MFYALTCTVRLIKTSVEINNKQDLPICLKGDLMRNVAPHCTSQYENNNYITYGCTYPIFGLDICSDMGKITWIGYQKTLQIHWQNL